jgi:hypothetical protein
VLGMKMGSLLTFAKKIPSDFWWYLLGAFLFVLSYNLSIVVYFFFMAIMPFEDVLLNMLAINIPIVLVVWYLLYNRKI